MGNRAMGDPIPKLERLLLAHRDPRRPEETYRRAENYDERQGSRQALPLERRHPVTAVRCRANQDDPEQDQATQAGRRV